MIRKKSRSSDKSDCKQIDEDNTNKLINYLDDLAKRTVLIFSSLEKNIQFENQIVTVMTFIKGMYFKTGLVHGHRNNSSKNVVTN